MKEYLFAPFRPKTTDLFFRKESPAYISPNDHVLVVGPGMQSYHRDMFLPMDRSLMVLPSYFAKGTGTITVMDRPEAQTDNCPHETAIVHYFEQLKKVIPVCPFSYIKGDLRNPYLKNVFNEKFDVIIDHLTTYNWVLCAEENIETSEELSHRVSNLYNHILSASGKALMFYMIPGSVIRQEDNTMAILKKTFHMNGSTIRDLMINDRYEIPVDLQQALPPNQKFLQEDILDRNGFLLPTHSATGVIIAEKI